MEQWSELWNTWDVVTNDKKKAFIPVLRICNFCFWILILNLARLPKLSRAVFSSRGLVSACIKCFQCLSELPLPSVDCTGSQGKPFRCCERKHKLELPLGAHSNSLPKTSPSLAKAALLAWLSSHPVLQTAILTAKLYPLPTSSFPLPETSSRTEMHSVFWTLPVHLFPVLWPDFSSVYSFFLFLVSV